MNELSVSTGISHIDSSFQRTMESLAQLKESINQLYFHLGKAQGIIDTMEIFYQHPVQEKKRSRMNETHKCKII